jgi:adenylate cyclase
MRQSVPARRTPIRTGSGMSDQDLRSSLARPEAGPELPAGGPAFARGLLAGLAAVGLSALLAQGTSLIERLDELAFDAQVRAVRLLRDPARALGAAPDVVIVGIDDESLDALGVPMALMHSTLGRALEAIASARPRSIGLDLALPQRSFDALRPGLDRDLMRGLLAARRTGPIVLALDASADGSLRFPSTPLLAAAGGPQAFGLPLFPVDCDGVVRRFDPAPAQAPEPDGSRCGADGARAAAAPARVAADGDPGALPSFAARVAAAIGVDRGLRQRGWIDYTRGAAFSYVPLRAVLEWHRRGDRASLQERFGGRVVLLGSVLPFLDRLRLPLGLAAWEDASSAPPGIVVNAQVLRNALGDGLLRPAGAPLRLAVIAFLCTAAFVRRPALRASVLAGACVLAAAGSVAAHAAGWFVPPAQAMVAGVSAVVLRTALDLAAAAKERERLTRTFGGYVSPQLLRAILDDRISAGGTRRAIAVLFADVRDFTAWSETADPALVMETLNRYYAAITPVLHEHGGTIDNFRGDGIMVMFGAPERRVGACAAAFAAARAMLAALERFPSLDRGARGRDELHVTIGLAFGEVVFGDLGSADRRDFTALGDCVNIAARLQDLAKQLDFPVLMTQTFARQLPAGPAGIEELGMHAVKGHTPVAVCGWRPDARAAVALR